MVGASLLHFGKGDHRARRPVHGTALTDGQIAQDRTALLQGPDETRICATGRMVDFRLTARPGAKAANAFLNKAIERVRLHRSVTVVIGRAQAYRRVIRDINHR